MNKQDAIDALESIENGGNITAAISVIKEYICSETIDNKIDKRIVVTLTKGKDEPTNQKLSTAKILTGHNSDEDAIKEYIGTADTKDINLRYFMVGHIIDKRYSVESNVIKYTP